VTGSLEAAIFDLDGLLVDSEPLWHEAELRIFAAHGVPITLEMVLSTKGRFVGEAARLWYDRHPWPGPGPEEVATEIVDAVAVLVADRLELKPGARHAVGACRARGLRLALASSSPRRLIDLALARHDLDGTFEVVHSAEEEPAGKPDPAVFLTAAAMLGVVPGRCLVLEDAPAGVEAARRAGMVCLAVPEHHLGGATADLVGAAVVLDSLEDLDGAVWARLAGAGA
jgi:sugar-phosphatase